MKREDILRGKAQNMVVGSLVLVGLFLAGQHFAHAITETESNHTLFYSNSSQANTLNNTNKLVASHATFNAPVDQTNLGGCTCPYCCSVNL